MKDVKTKKMVFVGLSGGVDSSVAALLLKEKGYEVIGVFMRCLNLDGCAERDSEDARRVAEKLGIPYYVWDFEEEYKRKVVDYMVEGYALGITPNPDVMCNKEIKFGLFLGKALRMGADYVATGHYVRIRSKTSFYSTRFARSSGELALSSPVGRRLLAIARRKTADQAQPAAGVSQKEVFSLLTARDNNKDQSYFLWTLTQDQLKHCLFPIGDYLKSEVREIAKGAGLHTADKKDSQGICFLGQVTLADFLAGYLPEKRGEVLLVPSNDEGTVAYKKVGEHRGAHFYTIGQRRGIGLGGGTPYYVAEKNVKTNTLVVAPSATDEKLYKKEVELADINFIRSDLSSIISAKGGQARLPASGGNGGIRVLARVRYRQPLVSATFYNLQPNTYHLEFNEPVKFVAPGQSAVFYLPSEALAKEGDNRYEMLGGGVISAAK